MTSLAKCLKKLKIDVKHEDVILKGLAVASREGKLSDYDAAFYAIHDAIDKNYAERDDVIAQMKAQGVDVTNKPKEAPKDERITKLEKHLKDAGYDFTVEPASVRDLDALDSAKKARKELAEKQAKLFKKQVVFVKADGPFRINGVMVPSIADTIFIDIRTDKAFDAIMAHELSHWMEQEKPAVYKELVKSLKTVIINEAEYAKKYGIEGATKAEITKEIVGDLMGDNFTEQSFWQKVAEANPESFKDIAATIIKWLKDVIVKAKANGMGSEQWVKDATKAQDIIAKAVAQYTDGTDVVVDQQLLDIGLTDTKKAPSSFIYDMQHDSQGVRPGKLTRINDAIAKGQYTLKDISSNWKDTRNLLRSRYGDSVTLYRADAPAYEHSEGTQVVYAGDKSLADKFATNGRKVIELNIPVDDVIAMYVTPSDYYEFVIKKPVSAESKPKFNRIVVDGIERSTGNNGQFSKTNNDILFSRTPKSLGAVKKSWDSKGITSSMSERNGIITLNKIVVPKDSRNTGIGTAAMRELTDYADASNQQIALTPSIDFGGSKAKLQEFYKRFGFKKNNEFNVMESMIRDPESSKFSRAPKLYSKLEQALEAANDKVFSTGPQVKLWLQSNAGKLGIKKDEIYWSDIDNWLDAQGKVSKQQVVEFVRNNGVKVEDVTLDANEMSQGDVDKYIDAHQGYVDSDDNGDYHIYLDDKEVNVDEHLVYMADASEALSNHARKLMNAQKVDPSKKTKHGKAPLTLPGGSDYKEIVVTVPTIEPHNADDAIHFGDTGQGKQIGWLRMNTRDGGLFIEELQSQRAQKGRSKGFKGEYAGLPKGYSLVDEGTVGEDDIQSWSIQRPDGSKVSGGQLIYGTSEQAETHAAVMLENAGDLQGGIPPAPFVSDANNKATNAYITLLIKKALIEAVSNDHASVSWTTGDQQAERYDLSKQIGRVTYTDDKTLRAYDVNDDRIQVINQQLNDDKELVEYIGKEVAEKLLAQPVRKNGKRELSGLALKTGGEWAQSMYGNEHGLNSQGKPSLMSQAANDIFKHVGSGKVESINGQPGFYVTPEMKSKDLPLFSRAGTVVVDGIERPTTNSEGKLINNPVNFWKWFGDSKVVDDQGRPLVVYHGSPKAGFSTFDEYEIGSNTLNATHGFYFTEDRRNASTYSGSMNESEFYDQYEDDQSAGVYSVYLKITDPYEMDFEGRNWDGSLEGEYDGHEGVPDIENSANQMGMDGVIITNVSDEGRFGQGYNWGEITYIAFDPNQIKSAIGNNGDYSSTNNDIRFSKAATPPDETRLRRFQRMNQDSFNRFTVIKEWLAENGQTLSDKADVYGAEERYHSMAANQLEDFREQQRNPLIEKIQKAGYTLGDIEVFLKMQHTQEANAQIRKIGDNPDATAYGIEDQEAVDYMVEAPEKLAALANEFRNITEQTKKLRLDNGVLSQEESDAYDTTYKHYIPVKGEADATRGVGKGLTVNFKSKRRLGHSLRDEHVIENILMDHERAILQVERNRVWKHVGMMAAEMQRPDILSIGQPEKRKVLKTDTAYTVEVNGVVNGVFKSRDEAKMFKQLYATSMPNVAPSAIVISQTRDQRVISSASPMLAENESVMYMNGHAIRIQVNDELMARALLRLGVEQFSDIVAAGRILNGYLSKVYTGYNPEFILTNMVRDFSSGTINLTGEQGFGMATKSLTNYPHMFTDLLKYAATNGKSSTRWIDSYRANGGNTGAAYLSDMERLGNEVNIEYASYQGVISNLKQGDTANAARAAGRKVFNVTLKWIYNLNQAGENAMRLAAFKAMIDSGRTVNEAAKVAKNITVNFNRKGERQWAPALYLFYNASVQGTAATAHALTKGKHKGQAWALAGSMAAVGYMMAASFGGGDEDDWDEINEYTKERNMLIKSGDGYVKVPVPYGYGFFWNFGRHIAEAQRTGELGTMPWHLATSAISEFTPFNDVVVGSDEEFRSDQVFMGLLPTAMKIVAQPTFNKQLFSGSELMPESQFDKSQPDRQKMFRSTKGTIYDEVAGWLDAAGIDVSPETLKYITRTGTGGAGSFVDTGISGAMLKSEGAELDIQEIPFVRKAYMELGIKDKRAAYYKVREEARTAAEEFNRARRDNDVAKMQTVLKDKNELIALDRYANKLAATIDAARDQQDAVRADKKLSVQEKRLKLKDMEATEAKFYDQYLDVFNASSHHK